ncbi:MAG: response regulator, partial [Anaerolineales bacterium]|nr:response regulator [Anaerolineales bacterium]
MPEQPIQLLLIEDNRDAAFLIRKLLEEIKTATFHITHVERLAAGLERLSAQPVDAILLDLSLPDSTGLETLTRVHAHQPHTPIIVMTGLDDETVALEAMRQGAQEYLIKGKSDGELIARAIRYAIERTRAEEALTRERNLLRALIDHLPDIINVKDTASRYVLNNPAHLRTLGVTRQEDVLGKTAFDFFPEPLAKQFYAEEQAIIRSGQPLAEVEEIVTDPLTGQSRWHLTTKVPWRDDQGKLIGVVTSSRDVTARKRAEEEILRRNAELTTLNQIGQTLNQLVTPAEIFETIATSIGQVMDNRNLYIAQYDEASQQISFPVYTIHGERQTRASRPFANGLTEYVIRTRAPLFVKRDLAGAMAERGIDLIGAPAHSFLAVP